MWVSAESRNSFPFTEVSSGPFSYCILFLSPEKIAEYCISSWQDIEHFQSVSGFFEGLHPRP